MESDTTHAASNDSTLTAARASGLAAHTSEALAIKSGLQAERARLMHEFNMQPRAERFLRGLARAHDVALRACWKLAAMPRSAALLAVGGYGRGELFPHSDVDVLMLLDQAPTASEAATIENLIGRWLGGHIAQAMGDAEKARAERLAREEVARSVADYCSQRSDRDEIVICK